MRYRGEIDGLRAVAVVPVILFHAGLKSFAGGFVGVDVFFVISGYLITTLIVSEKLAGRFSLVDFYERRARRILPALFLVALCCIPFAWAWMFPGQQKGFARSLLAVIFFVSNILFSTQRGYFAPSIDEVPLLHTWSLAVEEQYYLLFPLAILLAWRFGRRAIAAALVIGAALSLGLAQYESAVHPVADFYILPTRAWELFIGAIAAMALIDREPLDNRLGQGLSALGLMMIVFSVFAFSEATPFPSVYALVPTLGAALIIFGAGPTTLVNRALGSPPLVAIGLMSYSAYLWHQPLFAFARLRSLSPLGDLQFLILAGLAFALAWLTYLFIERPFRRKYPLVERRLWIIAPSAFLVLLAFGLGGLAFGGFPVHDSLEAKLEDKIRYNQGLSEECDYKTDFHPKPACVKGARPQALIWGDSFAMHLVDGIEAANPGLSFVQATKSTCGPILGLSQIIAKYPLSQARDCLSFNHSVFAYLAASPDIADVVLSSPFGDYAGAADFMTDAGVRREPGLAISSFEDTIAKIEALGKNVWVVSPPALSGDPIGSCLVKQSRFGGDIEDCGFSRARQEAYNAPATAFLKAIEKKGAHVVWLPDFTCKADRCAASEDGTFLYRDSGHLSHEGSRWIGANTPALKLQ